MQVIGVTVCLGFTFIDKEDMDRTAWASFFSGVSVTLLVIGKNLFEAKKKTERDKKKKEEREKDRKEEKSAAIKKNKSKREETRKAEAEREAKILIARKAIKTVVRVEPISTSPSLPSLAR